MNKAPYTLEDLGLSMDDPKFVAQIEDMFEQAFDLFLKTRNRKSNDQTPLPN